jgi:Flp pilus assembly protein CpaB
MRRVAYLVAFAILAGLAAILTLRAQHTVSVVVATHDVRAGSQVQSGDVQVASMRDSGLPSGITDTTDAVVGQYVAWPLTGGEPVLIRQLRPQRSGISVTGGLEVPAGYRAIAVPVQPADAVGGMIAPGDRVDVYETPIPGRADTATPRAAASQLADAVNATPAGATRLGTQVLVLQLRSDQGAPLDAQSGDTVHGLNFGAGKLGSVVLAVPDKDVPAYAAAVSGDTVYLALSVG